MAFVIKFVKGVRTHWKKSTFFAVVLAYGVNYANESYETRNLMRAYCLEAKKYGNQPIPVNANPKKITVILNPNANRRKATKQFEKYCAPILHLAGMFVDILKTDSEGHARKLVEELKHTDAIVIAGGDGTVSEVLTGLFRRTENDRLINPCPVGILPLGRTNTVGRILFPGSESLKTVKSLADAAMAVVEETTKLVDVMKIEIIEETIPTVINTEKKDLSEGGLIEDISKDENTQEIKPPEPPKPVYALASLEWGAYRDAQAKRDKYWYFGSLRNYVTYIFNGYKNNLNWECRANVDYLLPCEGCSNCYIKPDPPKVNMRWWNISRFYTKPAVNLEKDYSKIINEKCGQKHRMEIATADLLLTTVNTVKDPSISQLNLNLGPLATPYLDFVTQGWKTENGKSRNIAKAIQARQLEIVPTNINSKQQTWFSIDREDYELKPVKITLLPHVLKIFYRKL